MTVPKPISIPAARPLFPEEDMPEVLEQIAQVLRSGRLILGPRTRELEAEWARRVGARHAVALSSCTAALEIAMRWAKVGGREVVVPTNTFVATANAVGFAGGKVVFCDMDARDYCLDVDDALARVTPETAAVVVVHISGFVPHGLDKLVDACRARRVVLIEDCAHAHGSKLGERSVGALGDVGCWSFYPTKTLTSGVGGMITTDNEDVAAFARSLRHHGQGASLEEIVNQGNDWLMDEVRAVLALAQVRRLDDFVARRRAIAAIYDGLLGKRDLYTLPRLAAGTFASYYKYPVLLPPGVDRDAVRATVAREHGIEMGALYSPPAHLMPIYRATSPRLPVAESLLPRQITLPMHAAVTPADAERSVAALDDAVRVHSR